MAKLGGGNSNKIYLQVSGGNLVQRLDKDYQGDCIKRVLKMGPNAGKTVNELRFPSAEGFITNVEIKTGQYGNQVMVTLDNEIVVQFAGTDFISICNTLLNFGHDADLAKEINISTYTGSDGYGKFSIWQSGSMVQWYVKKENSEALGCPQATKKTVAGKVKWDFDDVENWYFEQIGAWIMTNFPNGAKATSEKAVSNISEAQSLADAGPEEYVKDIHKDVDASPAGYAGMPTGGESTPEPSGTDQAKAQTGATDKKKEEEISVEDLPF